MSNEISLNLGVNVSKGGLEANRSKAFTVDLSGDAVEHGMEEIAAGSDEEIAPNSDITTYGYCLLINLDSTNYVEVGTVTLEYHMKLKAGEAALFRCNNDGVFCKANTAACKVEYFLIED